MSNDRRGRVYRRCACRDETGKQLGQSCPRLASDGKHGVWYFAVDLPAPLGKRTTMRRGGFPTRAAASRALADVTNRAAIFESCVFRYSTASVCSSSRSSRSTSRNEAM